MFWENLIDDKLLKRGKQINIRRKSFKKKIRYIDWCFELYWGIGYWILIRNIIRYIEFKIIYLFWLETI